MRLPYLMAGAVVVAFFAVPSGQANAAAYCLTGDIDLCGFTTVEQCLEASSGMGGFCVADLSGTGMPTRRPQPRNRQ